MKKPLLRLHAFDVGQRVRLKPGKMTRPSPDGFTIVRRMPVDQITPMYRIKGDGEPHERIVAEVQLELLPPSVWQ